MVISHLRLKFSAIIVLFCLTAGRHPTQPKIWKFQTQADIQAILLSNVLEFSLIG